MCAFISFCECKSLCIFAVCVNRLPNFHVTKIFQTVKKREEKSQFKDVSKVNLIA